MYLTLYALQRLNSFQLVVLAILSLAMPIYGEETQVEKKQEKRGALGLGYGGYGGLGNAGLVAAVPAYGGTTRLKVLGARTV